MSPERRHRIRIRAITAVGPVVAVGSAASLVPFRGGGAEANVALTLAVVVVAVGALGGRVPAIVTSVAAALAFNVLHTRPYLSLHIDRTVDLVTTLMLVVLGLVSGLVTEQGWRHRDREVFRTDQLDRLHRIAELAVAADDATAVWPAVRDALRAELHLGACWFEPVAPDGLSFVELGHDGTLAPSTVPFRVTPWGYELPGNGVELSVTGGGKRLGRLVMLPDPGHALSLTDRRYAVAIADQFALVAARSPSVGPLW